MTLPAAEHLKNNILEGAGRRPWAELRRQISKPSRMKVPNYLEMKAYEDAICYPTIPFEGGIRADLQELVQVG